MMRSKHKPQDVMAEMQLENAPEKVNFKDAGQDYSDILGVTAHFDVIKSDTEVIMIMAKKVNSATYAKVILEHLSSTNPDDLEALCDEIGKI